MWKQDLEALLKAWSENKLIKKLEAVDGGIAITDTTETHWFYDHNEGTLIKIEQIIEGAQEDGDSVLDCSDGGLRELTEDWVADHRE